MNKPHSIWLFKLLECCDLSETDLINDRWQNNCSFKVVFDKAPPFVRLLKYSIFHRIVSNYILMRFYSILIFFLRKVIHLCRKSFHNLFLNFQFHWIDFISQFFRTKYNQLEYVHYCKITENDFIKRMKKKITFKKNYLVLLHFIL